MVILFMSRGKGDLRHKFFGLRALSGNKLNNLKVPFLNPSNHNSYLNRAELGLVSRAELSIEVSP